MRCDHVACSGCDFVLDIRMVPRSYALPWGGRVSMPQEHGWCRACDAIRPIESLSDEQLAVEAEWRAEKEAEARTDPGRLGLDAAYLARLREELETWRRLLQHRRELGCEQPACLRCRSTEVLVPRAGHLPHPTCGGELSIGFWLGGETTLPLEGHLYSPEGALLEVGHYYYRPDPGWRKPLPLWGSEAPWVVFALEGATDEGKLR